MSSLFIAHDAVLALYATGRQEGIVVDIGHKHSTIVPIIKGKKKLENGLGANVKQT